MKLKSALKTAHRAFKNALCWAWLGLPATSHAQDIQGILDKSASYLTGPLARSVGLVVLMGSGYLCLVRQKFPKEQLAMILVGLGIIYGSSSLYSTLVGY